MIEENKKKWLSTYVPVCPFKSLPFKLRRSIRWLDNLIGLWLRPGKLRGCTCGARTSRQCVKPQVHPLKVFPDQAANQSNYLYRIIKAMEQIVLVLYRDTTVGKHSAGPISAFTLESSNIIQSSNNYATQLPSSAGTNEFDETYNSTPASFLDGSSPGVLTNSNGASRSSLIERIDEIDSSPKLQIDEALKRIQKQLSSEHMKENGTFYNENEYPDDLGFTYNEQ
ncbi:hypothetical protein Tco_1424427, partial [Tanacetum coccineum]